MNAPSRSPAGRVRPLWPVLAGAAAVGAVLWLLRLPTSHHDDSFFAGAAIHVARTAELANPWIDRWLGSMPGVHADHFFLQPPYHSWLLGWWLAAFGIGTAAFTGFACTAASAAAGALGVLLRRAGTRPSAVAVGQVSIALFLMTRGLRPETSGIALLLLGAVGLHGAGRPGRIAGAFATFAAPLCHPILLLGAAASGAIALWHGRALPRREWMARLLEGAAGAAANLPLFLWSIDGRWTAFWHDLRAHAALVRPAAGHRWQALVESGFPGWERVPIALALSLAILSLSLAWAADPSRRPRIAVLGATFTAAVIAGFWLYAPFSVAFLVEAAALICLAATGGGGARLDRLLLLPAAGLALWVALGLTLQRAANSGHPAQKAEIQAYLAAHPPRLLGVDAYTLRHVFDFRPPEPVRALDWGWSPGQTGWSSPSDLPPDDAWVANPAIQPKLRATRWAPAPFVLLGHTFRSVRPFSASLLVLGANRPEPPPGVRWVRSQEALQP